MPNFDSWSIEDLAITTMRTLAIDAVEKANSGHPGTPMSVSPLVYLLYKKILRHNPKNPDWFNRDRFVLSAGHASMVLYSILHLSGYDISLDDLKNFRQLGSKTPGHPEHDLPGVETTTGPLGQGITNSVGMAIAEAHLAKVYNRQGHNIIDHYTYALCGDGDLMEGVSHEAASMAGHFGLGKLIWFYDDNNITIEGRTELTFSDDVQKRFEAYGWHVIHVGEKANDLPALADAIKAAQAETNKPSLIIISSVIGFGAPNKKDTSDVHGAPLGEEEVRLTKQAYGWPEDAHFLVPETVYEHMADLTSNGQRAEEEWLKKFTAYEAAFPELAAQLKIAIRGELPEGWETDLPSYEPANGAQATRAIGGKVLNAISDRIPFLIGGSADLNPSTKTYLNTSGYFGRNAFGEKNVPFGVREFGMAAAVSGMSLHGGVRPFASTFFVFTDYARPAMRLAALMELPVIYVMTHDSIGVGEDGPTHQPVEHLTALRLIPNMTVIRPMDANETVEAWKVALQHKTGPTVIVLTRQGLPIVDRTKYAAASNLVRGAYILSPEKGKSPDIILIASGSEVQYVLEAQEKLVADGIDARVVSMPSWELFRQQDESYKKSVLPLHVKKRLSIEAGSTIGWHEWVGDQGLTIGINRFGLSGPYKKVFSYFGFSTENVLEKAKEIL
ncbi:transketolase [candidate division KSB1 bacterium]|nr:transketolase [candidate division KSB1 bacterium]RQW06148.1 MAG: transketolase [candidate division KSB1 bacterium]